MANVGLTSKSRRKINQITGGGPVQLEKRKESTTQHKQDFHYEDNDECMPSWERLYRMGTASNLLKTVDYAGFNSEIQPDSLDLALNSTYDQEKDFSLDKAATLKQLESKKDTIDWMDLKENATMTESKSRMHYDKTLNVETPHDKASAQGYSRKQDGSFYKVTPSRIDQY